MQFIYYYREINCIMIQLDVDISSYCKFYYFMHLLMWLNQKINPRQFGNCFKSIVSIFYILYVNSIILYHHCIYMSNHGYHLTRFPRKYKTIIYFNSLFLGIMLGMRLEFICIEVHHINTFYEEFITLFKIVG